MTLNISFKVMYFLDKLGKKNTSVGFQFQSFKVLHNIVLNKGLEYNNSNNFASV